MTNAFVKKNMRIIVVGTVVTVVVLALVIMIPVAISSGKKTPDDDDGSKKPYDPSKLTDDEKSRINCFLEEESKFENLTRYSCEERGCIYNPSRYERVPTCYFNRTNLGYFLDSQASPDNSTNTTHYQLRLNPTVKQPYLGAVHNLNLAVEYLDYAGSTIVHVKITDSDRERYEVPYMLNDMPSLNASEVATSARFELSEDPETKVVSWRILRTVDNEVLFDTGFGGFVYTDKFLQVATSLSTEHHIYGFGENNHESLEHDLGYTSWGMFARDNAPGWGDNRNLYGTQPMYLGVNEATGRSHAVLLYNSNSLGSVWEKLKKWVRDMKY